MATIVVGDNSYVTVQEADAYFADRIGYDSWAIYPNKEAALISAASLLDVMCTWDGYRADPNQKLAFPRIGGPVPQGIKDAQCEIAFSISVAGSTVVGEADVLTKLQAGDVVLEFKGDVSPTGGLVSDYGKRLLSMFGTCSFGSGTTLIPVVRA